MKSFNELLEIHKRLDELFLDHREGRALEGRGVIL
jgi:hypothetical protein